VARAKMAETEVAEADVTGKCNPLGHFIK